MRDNRGRDRDPRLRGNRPSRGRGRGGSHTLPSYDWALRVPEEEIRAVWDPPASPPAVVPEQVTPPTTRNRTTGVIQPQPQRLRYRYRVESGRCIPMEDDDQIVPNASISRQRHNDERTVPDDERITSDMLRTRRGNREHRPSFDSTAHGADNGSITLRFQDRNLLERRRLRQRLSAMAHDGFGIDIDDLLPRQLGYMGVDSGWDRRLSTFRTNSTINKTDDCDNLVPEVEITPIDDSTEKTSDNNQNQNDNNEEDNFIYVTITMGPQIVAPVSIRRPAFCPWNRSDAFDWTAALNFDEAIVPAVEEEDECEMEDWEEFQTRSVSRGVPAITMSEGGESTLHLSMNDLILLALRRYGMA